MHRPLSIAFLGLSMVVYGVVGASAATPAAKVGFVDLQTTIDKTKVGRKARNNFDAAVKKKQADFKKKENELKRTSAELQKKASSLSAEERRTRQRELEKQYVELQEMYVKIQRDLAQQQAKLLDSIFTKAAPHIKAIAERDGYTIIFEKTQSALLWGDPGVDLTAEINKKL